TCLLLTYHLLDALPLWPPHRRYLYHLRRCPRQLRPPPRRPVMTAVPPPPTARAARSNCRRAPGRSPGGVAPHRHPPKCSRPAIRSEEHTSELQSRENLV